MQIWAGGEKLSDTKVGEFDRGPLLLLLLSAMQPTPPASIITDSVIRSTATCCRWNRPPFTTGEEKETYFILAGACAFPPLLLSGNEQMVITVRRENLPSFGQLFPADAIFSLQGRKWNFSVCCITSCSPPSFLLYLFFYQNIFLVGAKRRRSSTLYLKIEELSRAITCHPHPNRYTHCNRVVSIYRIIWRTISPLPHTFEGVTIKTVSVYFQLNHFTAILDIYFYFLFAFKREYL